MPFARDELAALFSHLDEARSTGCGHSLRFARRLLIARLLSESAFVRWLGEQGGYCA
jgi:hypothetical protein